MSLPANRKTRASILAIGTELTTGQITNRNAAWLSEKLGELGVEVVVHETVPDDRELIRDALERCARVAGLLFVTGGLGPTTDDFTREVLAAWAGLPLEFDEGSWQHIVSRLTRFGIRVAESNRQQCYFPRGATVLTNAQGTANGFAFSHADTRVWVLPGPPREVAAVWESGVIAPLRALLPPLKPEKLFTWQTLGKSESELGEITEAALAGSGLKTGYRAHMPFVEIKVWCPEDRLEKYAPWIQKLEDAIGAWVVTRQGEDLATHFLKLWQGVDEVALVDSATTGLLAGRLAPLLRKPEFSAQARALTLATEFSSPEDMDSWTSIACTPESDPDSLTLAISGFGSDGEFVLGLRQGRLLKIERLRSPWTKPELLDRTRSFAVEMALKTWADWLRAYQTSN